MGNTVNGFGGAPWQQMMASFNAVVGGRTGRVNGTRKSRTAPKKKLTYNHREIANQLVRVKKSQSCGTVLTRAKSKLAQVQRCAASGQYDEQQIRNALIHAKRMVRCARAKMQNLKSEEEGAKDVRNESQAQRSAYQQEINRRAAQREQELKQVLELEKLRQEQMMRSRDMDLALERRKHRSDEQKEIDQANWEYIEAEIKYAQSTDSGQLFPDLAAFVQLSAEGMMLTEAQIEQQARMEAEAEMAAVASGGMDMVPGMEMGDFGMGAGAFSAGAPEMGAAPPPADF